MIFKKKNNYKKKLNSILISYPSIHPSIDLLFKWKREKKKKEEEKKKKEKKNGKLKENKIFIIIINYY